MSEIERYDLALVGGGIMSATLGVLIKLVSPKAKIVIFERLDQVAMESSNPWHNAGTGHAALVHQRFEHDQQVEVYTTQVVSIHRCASPKVGQG